MYHVIEALSPSDSFKTYSSKIRWPKVLENKYKTMLGVGMCLIPGPRGTAEEKGAFAKAQGLN
jgi:hypothetical protein